MDAINQPAFTADQLSQATQWWSQCSDPWKKAFNEVALQRNGMESLPDDILLTVFTSPNHRFAGPQAPYPNVSFELEDLSGLVGLPNSVVVVVTHHHLTHLRELQQMPTVRALFVFNNKINSLEGIEVLPDLQELYMQYNEVASLLPLAGLTQLKTLYCSNNLISSLEGIGPQHADTMENLFCLPNPNLKDREVLRFEREVGIRCHKG